MRFRLNKLSSAFHLFGDTADQEGKLQNEEAVLNIRTVQLLPVVANDRNRQIATHNMKIPIRRVEVKTFTFSTGLRSKIEDHLFQGQLPKRLIIGMVANSDINWDPKSNPFNFQHFNLVQGLL